MIHIPLGIRPGLLGSVPSHVTPLPLDSMLNNSRWRSVGDGRTSSTTPAGIAQGLAYCRPTTSPVDPPFNYKQPHALGRKIDGPMCWNWNRQIPSPSQSEPREDSKSVDLGVCFHFHARSIHFLEYSRRSHWME